MDLTLDGTVRLARHIDHDRIAARAYQIYESHDRTDGHADEDWLQAEAEYAIRRENDLAVARAEAASHPPTRRAGFGLE